MGTFKSRSSGAAHDDRALARFPFAGDGTVVRICVVWAKFAGAALFPSYHNGSVWPHDVALCAAGSVFMLLQACLGLPGLAWACMLDGIRREVKIVQPHLPADIDQLHVQGLHVGSARVDLHFQRLEERIVVVAQSAPGTPRVDVNLQL
jgi:hypothetical protein